jgi:hypothetical protein
LNFNHRILLLQNTWTIVAIMITLEINWWKSMQEKCQPPRCHTYGHVTNVPHPLMHHPARLISCTSLWGVFDPWPIITCQHDSSPSHYWYSHFHYTM